jgi:phosphoribosylglycinamide formyltransferase
VLTPLQPYLKANPGKTRDDYDYEVFKMGLRDVRLPIPTVLTGWTHVFGDTPLSERTFRS